MNQKVTTEEGTVFKSDVVLGEKYREEVTGIEGTATGCFFYMHGCERVNIEVMNVSKGEVQEYVFDAPRLTRVDTEEKVTSERTGGYQPTPPRRGLH